MKNWIAALLFCLPLGLFAQDLKIGYINRQEVLSLMPEADAAMKQLEDMNLKYTMEGKKLQEEFQKKYTDYMASADTLDAAIRKYKENELARLQQSIEEFTQNAKQTLEKKQQDLMTPIIDKMSKAIKQVGDENGFTYIIDNTAEILTYVSPKAVDALPLVKKALNIQ